MNIKKYLAIICIAISITSCGNKSASETKETTEIVNGEATSTFKVWGNCDMCKETIEGALKIDGVSKAEWDTESKIITVSYDPTKISLDKIQKNVSGVGYDNEKYKGDDKVYSELPGCCQYERK